ncbi:MAG: hypothetical protein LBT26_10370 [Clostridiales Family XIII bacterium]|jgi:hypothetical protein|nr:hypothetical protein [Clostridiales Family XIII bacterium]
MTKNRRADVVRLLGEKSLSKLLDLADVYHCEALENTATDFAEKHDIQDGGFDNVSACKYDVPGVMSIAEDYQELIVKLIETHELSPVTALISVYTSRISDKIDDYNSSMYFENPQYLYESYIAGEPLRG